jgi:hypothetical protein
MKKTFFPLKKGITFAAVFVLNFIGECQNVMIWRQTFNIWKQTLNIKTSILYVHI